MAEQNLTRQCCTCKSHLLISAFSTHVRHDRENKVYINSRCDECGRAVARERYKTKREHVLKTVATYRAANIERIRERQRQYSITNRDRILAKKRDYNKRIYNSPEYQAKRKAFAESHREQLNVNAQRWRQRNPEKRRVVSKNNKIKRAKAVGSCSPQQWLDKLNFFGWRCYLCGIKLTSDALHMDHRKPITLGGSHWPANLAPACIPCNLRKNDKPEQEYRAIMKHQILGEKTDP